MYITLNLFWIINYLVILWIMFYLVLDLQQYISWELNMIYLTLTLHFLNLSHIVVHDYNNIDDNVIKMNQFIFFLY